MKKTDVYLTILLVLIVTFSFIGLQNDKVIGQTTSSSSSGSSGTTTTSSSSGTVTASSSSSGTTTSTSSGVVSTSSSSGGITSSSSSSGGTVSSSSSGAPTAISLNNSFTGIWKARLIKGSTNPSTSSSGSSEEPVGSRIVTLKLCIKDGKLEGTVQQGGVIEEGNITSQNVVSANEVSVTVKDKKNKSITLTLKLLSDRQMTVTFADGRTADARKLNSFRGCLAPGQPPGGHNNGEGTAGPGEHGNSGMSFMGGSEGTNGMSFGGMDFPGMSMMGGSEGVHGNGMGFAGGKQ